MIEIARRFRRRLADYLAALRSERTYTVERVPELPDHLEARVLYLLGECQPWCAALLCPCGCKEIIQLSLLESDSPSWRLHINARSEPTVDPSIWRKAGCRSHFYIRRGRIAWYKRA
jgi:hypothetical protein